MVFPPPILQANRTNTDPQMDTHAADHNALALASGDITERIEENLAVRKQESPSGSLPTGTWTRLTHGTMEFTRGRHIRGDTESNISDVGGFFLLYGTAYWGTSNAAGRRIVGFSTSTAVTPIAQDQSSIAGCADAQRQQIWLSKYIAAPTGARFCLWAFQDSGATMNLNERAAIVLRLTPHF